jgi:hypothetical protein
VYRICAGFFLNDSSTDKRPDTVRFNDAPFASPRLQYTTHRHRHRHRRGLMDGRRSLFMTAAKDALFSVCSSYGAAESVSGSGWLSVNSSGLMAM